MNPTFKEIWTSDGWAGFWIRTSGQMKHGQNWYQIRSVVRIVLWVPLTAWVCLSILEGWASLI